MDGAMLRPMRIIFVMDPPSTIIVDEDTTFGIMLAAQARGHRIDYARARDVWLDGDRPLARIRSVEAKRDPANPLQLGEPEEMALEEADVVFIRKDPPFDRPYLWLTLILEHLRDAKTVVVNDPRALRDANEKLYTHHFAAFMPRTMIVSDESRIRSFLSELGGEAIIKPVDGHGGADVYAIGLADRNLKGLIASVTHGGSRVAVVQALVPEISEGDKRILLLDGEPIGAILRVPTGGDIRSNIHVGGKVVGTELNARELEICAAMGPRLRADGLFFVGIDVIGPYLTEVNVTSPTGIQQASRLAGEDLEAKVIVALEQKVSR
jgi:glutathione synthase